MRLTRIRHGDHDSAAALARQVRRRASRRARDEHPARSSDSNGVTVRAPGRKTMMRTGTEHRGHDPGPETAARRPLACPGYLIDCLRDAPSSDVRVLVHWPGITVTCIAGVTPSRHDPATRPGHTDTAPLSY